MSNRFKRALVLISLGGMAFGWGLWGGGAGCHPLALNEPYVQFLVDTGNYAVNVGVDNAFANIPANLNTWFNDPVTTVYQSLWTGFVRNSYPQDPTYNTLLVQ